MEQCFEWVSHTHTPESVFLQEAVQFFEFGTGHKAEQLRELALPLVTMLQQREFEWRTIQQHELQT